jgi:hypothetical protein
MRCRPYNLKLYGDEISNSFSLMMATKMVLETLVYSLVNYLTRLLVSESLTEHNMRTIDSASLHVIFNINISSILMMKMEPNIGILGSQDR